MSPDGLNLRHIGGFDEGVQLVGLYEENTRSVHESQRIRNDPVLISRSLSLLPIARRSISHLFFPRRITPICFILGREWVGNCTYGDLDAVVGEDQGRVGDSKLGGRHLGRLMGEREVVSRIAGGLVDREGEGRESRLAANSRDDD